MENKQNIINEWLRSRGISDDVIVYSKVHYDEGRDEIAIPIFDLEGTFLFNKYRRGPWNDDTSRPKYRYASGATAQLYRANARNRENHYPKIIITEGELDALRIASVGYDAASSTGGAGTFLPEWTSYFEKKDPYICLDTDEAGIKGAFKIQGLIPHAKIIWLPKGKDITEFFLTAEYPNTLFENLIENAKTYAPPKKIEWGGEMSKMEIRRTIKENEASATYYLHMIDMAKQESKPYKHLDLLLTEFNRQNEADRHRVNFMGKNTNKELTTIADAKKVPITNFLEFPYTNTICCIWHDEKTPSMHYYPEQNVVKCFGGCNKRGDVIDVVQQLKKCSLQEAIKIILQPNE